MSDILTVHLSCLIVKALECINLYTFVHLVESNVLIEIGSKKIWLILFPNIDLETSLINTEPHQRRN